jgi:hypothetical protein
MRPACHSLARLVPAGTMPWSQGGARSRSACGTSAGLQGDASATGFPLRPYGHRHEIKLAARSVRSTWNKVPAPHPATGRPVSQPG